MRVEIVHGERAVNYHVRVAGREYTVRVDDNGVWVDGEHGVAELQELPGSARRQLRWNGEAAPLFARRSDAGWLIEVYGREFLVQVEDERTRELRQLSSSPAHGSRHRDVRAPMPGLIVRLEVELGQEVEEGTGLIIMEAMKMENEIQADAPGRVSTIEVRPGDKVERDQLLLRLE